MKIIMWVLIFLAILVIAAIALSGVTIAAGALIFSPVGWALGGILAIGLLLGIDRRKL